MNESAQLEGEQQRLLSDDIEIINYSEPDFPKEPIIPSEEIKR